MLKPDSNGFEDLVNEYLNTPSSCDGSGLKFMQLKRLDRIADALEGIDSSLKEMSGSLEELTDCIGYAPPRWTQKEGHHFLRICGNVDPGN